MDSIGQLIHIIALATMEPKYEVQQLQVMAKRMTRWKCFASFICRHSPPCRHNYLYLNTSRASRDVICNSAGTPDGYSYVVRREGSINLFPIEEISASLQDRPRKMSNRIRVSIAVLYIVLMHRFKVNLRDQSSMIL